MSATLMLFYWIAGNGEMFRHYSAYNTIPETDSKVGAGDGFDKQQKSGDFLGEDFCFSRAITNVLYIK